MKPFGFCVFRNVTIGSIIIKVGRSEVHSPTCRGLTYSAPVANQCKHWHVDIKTRVG